MRLTVFSLLCAAAAAEDVGRAALRQLGSALEESSRAGGFVRALEFKHRLRVCNAYPYSSALDVYRGRGERLTGSAPMPYKDCRDFETPLRAGDKLDFKVGDASAGTFSVADLPNNDAVLLLVIHRHDTLSTAVSFESHVFANLLNAQVAVIDAYKGAAKATPTISDEVNGKVGVRSEELRFDSVVAVSQGLYQIALSGSDGKAHARSELVALDSESYVVLRTGVEAQQGPSFPEELVVFPRSDARVLRSGAAAAAGPWALLAALLAAPLAWAA